MSQPVQEIKYEIDQLPNDLNFYYLNLFNVPKFAKPEDIMDAFKDLVCNVYPAGTSNRCWDLEFKDKISLF